MIKVVNGLLKEPKELMANLSSALRMAIITDDHVATLYGKLLCEQLGSSALFSFAPGEKNKNRTTKEQIEDQLFEKGFSRDSCIVALGGGVVTDLAGFVAATFCRGVTLINIPTTLLAMVDASIGGKTGVNVVYGKNMVGSFYPAKKVLIDPSVLKTLPNKELRNGLVEMIKHGLIADGDYFTFLENSVEGLLALDENLLEKGIKESCRIKMEIVAQDEKENGKRVLLNFGHTIGHALESLTNYSMAHGEAVALGILVESYIAMQLRLLNATSFERIFGLIKKVCVKLEMPQLPLESVLEVLLWDKKAIGGQARFVMIDEIGSALSFAGKYCKTVDEDLIKNALLWVYDALPCHMRSNV